MGWVHGFGVRRSLGASAAVAAVVLGGGLVATAPATALAPSVVRAADAGSGTAEIGGRIVVPGTGTPPAGVTVSLHGVPTSGDAIDRTVVAKADGSFTFRDLAGGDWVYTITAPYQGATFSTDPVQVPAGQGLSLKLPVFTPTDSAAKIKTSSWIVWLDNSGGKFSVEQDVSYTNSGTTAYVGTTPVSGATPGAKAAVLLSIAPQAGGFQYLGRFEVCCSASTGDSWAHTRPIDPGGSSGTLRYEAPQPTSLAFKAQFPADGMTLLAPQGMTVSSPLLKRDGTTTDKGTTYDVYKATSAIKAGDTVSVSLSGGAAATDSSVPWWVVALAAIAVLVVAGAVVVLLRRRRSPGTPTTAAAKPQGAKVTAASPKAAAPKPAKPAAATPAAKSAPAAKPTATATATQAAAPRSKAEVLAEELAQLDLKFESGELTDEAAYRRVRESLVQQLMDTVAGDPTSLR